MGEVPKQLKPYLFKKGNKLGGRKKGKSLKEYSRDYLAKMTDEERTEYLNGINRESIWKMAEGNPHQGLELEGEVTTKVELTDEQFERLIRKRGKELDSPESV